jgi:type IV secretion system protein VirB10
MTDDPTLAPPAPKTPPPPLSARAPRPAAVRVRRTVVAGIVLTAGGLLAGAFAWAFVVQPELRAEARARSGADDRDPPDRTVRPSEAITDGPEDYADLDRLPPPRGAEASEASTPAPSSPRPPARVLAPVYGREGDGRDRARVAADVAAEARRSALFFPGTSPSRVSGEADVAPQAPTGGVERPSVYSPHALIAPLSPYELKAGAIVPAALLTGVGTSRAGPVMAVVTAPVFDTVSGRHLLIPQGTRLIGRHEGDSRYGDRRAFLVWQRLMLPNGNSLVLADEPGVDAQGTVGVEGRVDRRLGALLTGTLFAGAITTLGALARDRDRERGGFWGDAGDAAAIEGAEVGGRLVERELEVRPSIALRPGAVVRVLITRDLILEPYRP